MKRGDSLVFRKKKNIGVDLLKDSSCYSGRTTEARGLGIWDQRDSELGFGGVPTDGGGTRPAPCVPLRSPAVGVAAEMPRVWRVSDGLPLLPPGGDGQSRSVAGSLPHLGRVPRGAVPSTFGRGEACQWGMCGE